MNTLTQFSKELLMWDWIVELKKFCVEYGKFPLSFNPSSDYDENVSANKASKLENCLLFGTARQYAKYLIAENQIILLEVVGLHEKDAEMSSRYIKFLYLAHRTYQRSQSRPMVLAHLAQTLDAKVATTCGNSQWISNHENLVHAHRLRALADAVCVGGKTLELDKPQLTVRHVKGKSPQIVVISQGSLCKSKLSQSYPNAWFYSCDEKPLELILKDLFHKNIRFLFVEGGAKTVSRLLENKYVDILQLHISPKLLGSGRNIQLPEAEHISESIAFSDSQFVHVGNEIMFEGTPAYDDAMA